MPPPRSIRVIAYIDGFNLYYGMPEARLRRFYWLDMVALARNLLSPGQVLVETKYFTARVSGPSPADSPAKALALAGKQQRQTIYFDALGSLPDLSVFQGHYLPKSVRCFTCGANWTSHEEKMTDVSMATEMLTDVFTDSCDMVLLISADSDLAPPVRAIRKHYPVKRVVVGLPPKRRSHQLQTAANAFFHIDRRALASSQLPDPVVLRSGVPLARPAKWR